MTHVQPVTISRQNTAKPFAALAAHIHQADVTRAKNLKRTAAARAANKARKEAK